MTDRAALVRASRSGATPSVPTNGVIGPDSRSLTRVAPQMLSPSPSRPPSAEESQARFALRPVFHRPGFFSGRREPVE